jgi:hypothetical protein
MGSDIAGCGKIARWIFLLFFVAGCYPNTMYLGGDGEITDINPPPATITISLVHVSAGYVRLAVVSSFNADEVPVYRNGVICGHVDLNAISPTEFVDTNFSGGGEYSYRVEGLFFFNGRVESNLLTVTVPAPGG